MKLSSRSRFAALFIFFGIVLWLPPGLMTRAGADEKVQQWAVVAGVAYGKPGDLEAGVQPLRNTLNDARLFTEFLGLPEGHVATLYDRPDAPAETRPTKANLISGLKTMMQKAHRDDIFWFYFSGHGLLINGRSYLAPLDVSIGKSDSMLSVTDVRRMLAEDCPARIKILVLDACQSGSAKQLQNVDQRDANADVPDPAIMDKNVVTLAACQVNQSAWEVPDMGGLFTYYLMRGLNGAAIEKADTVTLAGLESYIARELEREFRERPLSAPQKPVFFFSPKVAAFPIAARNDDAIHRLDGKKNKDKPTKIEPLQPGLVLAVTDAALQSSADTSLLEARLRAAMLRQGVPLIPAKEVAQFLSVFNAPAQDEKARQQVQMMGSRFLVKVTLRKQFGIDALTKGPSCKLWLDYEILDANGDAKIADHVPGGGWGDTPAAAEQRAYDDAVERLMKKLQTPVLSLMKRP